MPPVNRRSILLLSICAAALLAALLFWLRPTWLASATGWNEQQWDTISFFVVVASATVALVIVLWGLLTYHLKPAEFTQRKDIVQLIAEILGGATLIITLFSTWQGVRENEAQLRQNEETSRRTMEIAQQTLEEARLSRLADRYTRATDQLGTDQDRRTRIAAIYALGHIASESDEFYWPVVQLLTSYVVENAPLGAAGKARPADQIPADVQAAMNALAWRKGRFPVPGNDVPAAERDEAPLELRRVDLRGLILKNRDGQPETGAHFEGAKFDGADLSGATTNLRYAHFEHAVFSGADLNRASLFGARLRGAGLNGAVLDGTDLTRAEGLTRDQVLSAASFECVKLDSGLLEAVKLKLEQEGKKVRLDCPDEN